MSMNCDINNLEVFNILDVENSSWYETLQLVIISNYYISTSNELKKLKISWKSLIILVYLTNFVN